jgi:ATP-dependent Lhr-like helicase
MLLVIDMLDVHARPPRNAAALRHIEEQRDDLGELLRAFGPAIQFDSGQPWWWTFAGGRVNHALKYGLEIAEGWKLVADNILVRIEGEGVGHETVRATIHRLGVREFWTAAEVQHAILARLPNYRLSKFQDCLPERFALEVIANYLLDTKGTLRWLQDGAASLS